MAQHITSGTTTGGSVSTITFATWFRGVEIVNRSSGDMWARLDGVDPTIAGDECFFIPANSFIAINNPKLVPEPALSATSNTEIRLITATAATYTVSAGV